LFYELFLVRGLFESYRYALWKDLVDGAFDFDFVGTNQDLWLSSSSQFPLREV
jgi:hypothetical protein